MLYRNEILLQDVAYVFDMPTVLRVLPELLAAGIVVGQGHFQLKWKLL